MNELAETVGKMYATLRYGLLPPTAATIRRSTTPEDLASVRQTVLTHPKANRIISRRYRKEMSRGDFLEIKEPSVDVRNLILFFEPPPPQLIYEGETLSRYFLNHWNQKAQTDFPPDMDESVPFRSETQEFLNKLWVSFTSFELQQKEERQKPVQSTYTGETHRIEMWTRFGENFKSATKAILVGFGEKRRRTGELEALHSLRVGERVKSDPITEIAKNNWILYITYLSAILHDAKEDLENFTIINTGNQTYEIRFGEEGHEQFFPLHLSDREFELLNLQMKAVSVPKSAENLPPEKKAQEQFKHLRTSIQDIKLKFRKYGLLAAYSTLLIKFADRIDNLCTYYAPKEGSDDVTTDLRAKLSESIKFFKQLETLAWEYRKKILGKNSGKVFYTSDSVINFCTYLLLGGNYQELFGNELRRYQEMRETLTVQDDAIVNKNFLIPMILPAGNLEPGLIYKIEEE